jgi:hypothetical protein
MPPQYSDKTSKSKRLARLDIISVTIKGEVFYSTSELLCACLLGGFFRIQIIKGGVTRYTWQGHQLT